MIHKRTKQSHDWLGYPKGAWLIIGVEFWERFSFYGMLSILALFLTASPMRGGFGWSATDALALVGAYTGAMYAFPVFGGYLADRVLSRRSAVTMGATFMMVGQAMLATPVLLVGLQGWWHEVPLLQALHELGVPLGHLLRSEAVETAIAQHGPALNARAGIAWLGQAYTVTAIGFFGAIFCLVLGNALMKSTLVVLCGETLPESDPRREAAYYYYYLAITVGGTLSPIIVGSIAATAGWQFGFMVAAMGMAVALGSYLVFARRWLGDIGLRPDRRAPVDGLARSASASKQDRIEARRRIAVIVALALLQCAFSVGGFQLLGSWSLFIEGNVDRAVGSFVIPTPWFSSMNGVVLIVLAPPVAALWVYLGTRNRHVNSVQKIIFALAMVTIGHVLMCIGARYATPSVPTPLWIPAVAVSLLAIGELVAWPAMLGIVSRVAPAGYASVTMGALYLLTLGLGGYLSGLLGQLVDLVGFTAAFGSIATIMGAACVVAVVLHGPLLRLAGRAGVAL
jgi:proton-dependent oligopeptide transporter, POT family